MFFCVQSIDEFVCVNKQKQHKREVQCQKGETLKREMEVGKQGKGLLFISCVNGKRKMIMWQKGENWTKKLV